MRRNRNSPSRPRTPVAMLPLERRMLLASAFIDPPFPPAVLIDTTYTPGTGNTVTVPNGGNLQQAITDANLGDTIVLPAGATFSGGITLPNKTTGSGWITIRTSAADSELPAVGTRITPAQAPLMPKIVSSGSGSALSTMNNAHHYRFIGVEFTVAAGVSTNTGIVVLGGSEANATQYPNNLIFDRCYIHGNATGNMQNGMRLNSASTAVIDSYFDQCQADAAAFESHCIGGYSGPGPYKLVNNTFNGATEPVIFGGATPTVANTIPSDMEIRNNYFTRPASWRTEHPEWYVKNLFELKSAQRVLFDGNVLENNWPHTGAAADGSQQQGYAILLTTRVTSGSWAVVNDITITNNVIRKSTAGMSLYGGEASGAQRIKIANNLFDDINMTWGTNDRTGMFAQFQTVGDTQFDHNTIINDGDIMNANGTKTADLDFTNNIVHHDATSVTRPSNPNKGINGPSLTFGVSTLNAKFNQYLVTKNAMISPSGNSYASNYTGTAAGNIFTISALSGVGFVDLTNHNYRLNPATSTLDGAATDGTDIGANFTTLEAAVAGAISFPFTGTSGNDTYYVKRSGDLLLVYNNATGTGTPILSDRYVYYESLSFVTGDGLDTVIVDYAGGNPIPAGGIVVDAGSGTSAGDTVQIIGNNNAVTYTPTSIDRGTISAGGGPVTMFNMEYVTGGNLSAFTVVGANAAETFVVDTPQAGKVRVNGPNGAAPSYPWAIIDSSIPLILDGVTNEAGGGSVDTANVNAPSISTLRFLGGGGNNVMNVNGGALTFNSDLAVDSPALAVTVASGATLTLGASQHLSSLSSSGQVTVPANGTRTLVTKGLSISGSGKLNLNDNAMVVDWSGSSVLPAVQGYVATGRNGGGWNGASGIVTAMSNAIAPKFLATIGVAEALNVLNFGAAQTATWEGQSVDKSAVLVGYTFTGDATLNGTIDGDDYFMIDAGFPGATNYYNGNFDYTGAVSADDYFLIDANYSKAQIAMAPVVGGAELPGSPILQAAKSKDDLLDVLI